MNDPIEINLRAIAMAPIDAKGEKKWIIHGHTKDHVHYRLSIIMGDDQFQMGAVNLPSS
jgi:hypothetical protein